MCNSEVMVTVSVPARGYGREVECMQNSGGGKSIICLSYVMTSDETGNMDVTI